MNKKIRILLVEDLPSDAELAIHEIGKVLDQYTVITVETRKDFEYELKNFKPDLVISDYILPSFDGLTALKLTLKKSSLIPVIILTGSMNEDTAVECMKAGATDYVIKEHIKRLGVAIINALEQKEIRKEKEKAENDFRASEERYRYMFAHNPQPMMIINIETWAFLEVNEASVKHYNYSREEFLSMTLNDILPRDEDTSSLNLTEGLANPHASSDHWHHLTKKGEIIDVEITSHSIDYNGIKAWHLQVNDITQRKKSEARINLLSKAIKQSPVTIVITDPAGKIEYVNPKFTDITGYTDEEVLGKNPSILRSGEHDQLFYQELWNTVLSGKEWSGEFQNRKKNGDLYRENASISPIFNDEGEITNLLGIKLDVTEKHIMVEYLMAAKEKAEAGDRLKTAFINNISHEIRTPLNGILGFSDLITDPDNSIEDKLLFKDYLQKSSFRLLNTINDYMDISLVASGNMPVHPDHFLIHPLLEELLEEFSVMSKIKNIELSVRIPDLPEDIQLFSDPELIRKILIHLIDNAIKFTPKGAIIFGFRKKPDVLEFFCEDTGVGIDDDKKQLIFDYFMQADNSSTRGYEGNGLGLSIAQGIAKLLDTKIEVESQENIGSTFSFKLPENLIVPASEAPVIKQIQHAILKNPTILVAEDDDFNYKYIEIVLKQDEFNVIRAFNGAEAVSICRNNPDVNLVLMDMKMPVMGGLEATRLIKSFLPKLQIIALTAYVSSNDEYEAFINGCDEFLPKPIDRSKLNTLIHKSLGIT